MLPQLAMTALSGGLSLMSGKGQADSTAKQGRLQMMEDARMDALNQQRVDDANRKREALAREALGHDEYEFVKQKTTSSQDGGSTSNTRSDHENWNWSETSGDVDIDGFMAAGEKAGFNPVTWLNSGALSLFARSRTVGADGGWSEVNQTNTNWSKTTDTYESDTKRMGHNVADLFKMMSPDYVTGTPTQIPRVPSMLEVLGNAGTAALSTAKDFYKQDSSKAFQESMLDRQLQALANRNSGGGGSTGGNTVISTGPRVTSGGATGGNAALGFNPNQGASNLWDYFTPGLPIPKGWEVGKAEVTNPWQTGKVDPSTSNAETKSDRYGDLAEEVFGIYNLLNDGVYNLTGGTNIPGVLRMPYDYAMGKYVNPTTRSGSVTPYLPFPGAAPGY